MKRGEPHRRAFLRRLAMLGLAGAGYLVVREQLKWPTPQVVYRTGSGSGWLTLLGESGLLALPARVSGRPVQAIVDSGAQYSAVDAGLAQALGLPAATPIPMVAFGVSGGPSLTRGVRLDADLGAFAIHGLRAATLDLHPLSRLTRQPFSLLLGRDFLGAVVLEAELPRRRIAFLPPAQWTPPADARAVPVRPESGALMVEVRVEGGPPVEVMLDTGATGGLALSETAARAAGLFDGRPMRTSPSVTLGGVSHDILARARQIAFAGETFDDVEVQIYRPAANAPVPPGLLGLGILEQFRLALDLPGGRLFLMERKAPPRGRRAPHPARFGGFADSALRD